MYIGARALVHRALDVDEDHPGKTHIIPRTYLGSVVTSYSTRTMSVYSPALFLSLSPR